MNILLAPTSFLPRRNGAQVTVQNLATALIGKGHRAVVVTPKLQDSHPSFEVIEGIEVHRMHFVLPWRFLWQNPQEDFLKFCVHGPILIRRIIQLIRLKGIEIINIHHLGPQLPYLLLAQSLISTRSILTLYGNEFFRLNPSDRIRRVFLRYAFRKAQWIVAPSSQTMDEIVRFSPNASRKIVQISPGVSTQEFGITESIGSDLPYRYILSLSRLNAVKGHDVLLKPFRRLRGVRRTFT